MSTTGIMSTITSPPSRLSTDSTTHLLSSTSTTQNSRPSRPPSIAPSITSVLSDATTITAPTHIQRGFASRESYLAALNEFAERKSHMETHEHTLHGWYGGKTADEYKARLSLREERRLRKEGERREQERRRTLVGVPKDSGHVDGVEPGNAGGNAADEMSRVETKKSQKEGRMRRLSRVFTGGRRATVA